MDVGAEFMRWAGRRAVQELRLRTFIVLTYTERKVGVQGENLRI